jgi:hypothetical protein
MMNLAPKRCRITKETTLEELCVAFNLTKEQLRKYHNIYCPKQDYIGNDIPKHVEIIFLPPDDKDLRERIFNPDGGNYILYVSENTLEYNKPYKKRYGIVQNVFHDDEHQTKLHYEMELDKTNSKLEIVRHPVYVNDQRPDLMMEQIADKIGGILYPLVLQINDNGTIRAILSNNEIQNRWKQLKPELQDYYEGPVADGLFKTTEEQLKNAATSLKKIKDSIFYAIFFFPLYDTFNNEKELTFQMELTIFADKPKLLYQVTLLLDTEISKSQKFIIKASGKCIDDKVIEEIENGKHISEGGKATESHFNFIYKLNTKDNSIFSIYGEVEVKLAKFNKRITFECYEQFN